MASLRCALATCPVQISTTFGRAGWGLDTANEAFGLGAAFFAALKNQLNLYFGSSLSCHVELRVVFNFENQSLSLIRTVLYAPDTS